MTGLSAFQLKTLRLILEDQIVREQDGTLRELAREPLQPKVAKTVEQLIRLRYAKQTHDRIHATWKGAHAEHEQVYARYVRKRDDLMAGSRKSIKASGTRARIRKELAKLRAFEAAHPQFPAKPE